MTHIGIIVAKFYEDIASELVSGAIRELESVSKDITYDILEVPGAFEIPSAINIAFHSGRFDGFIALGCVIRGETSHYDYVCLESARGINQLAMEYQLPIGYGILTVETMEQAWARAALSQGNKGRDAAIACLQMLKIKQQMEA